MRINHVVTKFTENTLTTLAHGGIDFTVFFDRLTRFACGEPQSHLLELFDNAREGAAWLDQWQALRSNVPTSLTIMRRANPAVIARNHLVEQAIDAAVARDDFEPFRRL